MPNGNPHQEFERQWWGDAGNTYGEETKQLVYAQRMGLAHSPASYRWPTYDLGGRSVVDLGGGPVSMLLKTVNVGSAVVVDPCAYPAWVAQRYASRGIDWVRSEAETFKGTFDEAWIYNVLQHVRDPHLVIAAARNAAPVLRLFEWLETPPTLGHPHTLHCDDLNRWIGGGANGKVELLDESGCHGLAYSGVFA